MGTLIATASQYWIMLGSMTLVLAVLMATRYRPYVAFLLAGMVFWLLIEASSHLLQWLFGLRSVPAYLIAGLTGLTLLTVWVVRQDRIRAQLAREQAARKPRFYAEHNPGPTHPSQQCRP